MTSPSKLDIASDRHRSFSLVGVWGTQNERVWLVCKKFHKTRKNPSQMSAETKAKIKKYWADRKFKIANNLPLAFAKPKKGHIGRR